MARTSRNQGDVAVVSEVAVEEMRPDDDDVVFVDAVDDGIVQVLDAGTDMGPRPDNAEQGQDNGRWDGQRLPHEPAPDAVANTSNIMGSDASLADWQSSGDDEVEISSVTVTDQPEGPKMFRLRVIEDIGPVFYGRHEFALQKGVLYAVPDYIEEYLRTRGKIWSYS